MDLCRWTLGGVFSFSGIVKCVDPVGTSIFVEKYLATFSLDLLLPLALPIAVLLSVVEFVLGQLLLNERPHRITAVVTVVIMSLFTVVTLLNATILPIGDCGCFGDAVKLTPLQTLLKNLALLPLSVLTLVGARRGRFDYLHTVTAVAISLGVCLYALRYQPIIDFMPYDKGVNLLEEVTRERQELDSQSSTSLVFRDANGHEVLFASDDTECWLREDLEFVESRTETSIAEPLPFAEFIVTNGEGEDCTLELLKAHRDVKILCISSFESLRGRRLEAVRELLRADDSVVVLSSADAQAVVQVVGREVFSLDAMTLRSFIRSRVGVVELCDGVITHKCDIRDL